MDRVLVQPISKKAKNRFANLMGSDGTCVVEQMRDGMMFLTSRNGKNHFWIQVDNDPHWVVQ